MSNILFAALMGSAQPQASHPHPSPSLPRDFLRSRGKRARVQRQNFTSNVRKLCRGALAWNDNARPFGSLLVNAVRLDA